MKLLFFELFIIFFCGSLAYVIDTEGFENSEICQALSIQGKCTPQCPCYDGAECSEDGFCMSKITLEKRYTCSSLRARGKCNSSCPCIQSGHCCSKYGYCGSSEAYCGKKTTTRRSTTTTRRTTTTKKATTYAVRSSSYSSSSSYVSSSSSGPGVILYLPSYRLDSEINVKTFDFSKINIFNYCFFQITDKGEAYSGNPDMDFKEGMIQYVNNDLKRRYPHLKTVLVIGGTQGSKNFKNFLSSSSTLNAAAKSIVKAVVDYKFDGLDIDWEFPKSEAEAGYLLQFIKKIREYMGYKKILTISASALTSRYYGHTNEMNKYLDWFNLMTYHYAGYWNKYSGYNSPLYAGNTDKNRQKDCDYTVESYLEEGVPRNKLVLGVPFMGQAWKVESTSNNGYNQVGNANIKGEPSNGNREGFWSYRSLREEGYLTGKRTTSSSWVRTWHSDVKSPTILNKSTRIYISYEDVDSVCERSRYVKNKRIGGIMVWETGQDYKRELLDSLLDCY